MKHSLWPLRFRIGYFRGKHGDKDQRSELSWRCAPFIVSFVWDLATYLSFSQLPVVICLAVASQHLHSVRTVYCFGCFRVYKRA